LTEAISLGHDLANSPYGHAGNEYAKARTVSLGDKQYTHEFAGRLMTQILASRRIDSKEDSQSRKARALHKFEAQGNGTPMWRWDGIPFDLDLARWGDKCYELVVSPEVIDGIMNHGSSGKPSTIEGQIVKHADNFAYVSQDIDDLLQTRILKENDYIVYQDTVPETNPSRDDWNDLNQYFPQVDLRGLFNARGGLRIATMIGRFVGYNLERLSNGTIDFSPSSIKDRRFQC